MVVRILGCRIGTLKFVVCVACLLGWVGSGDLEMGQVEFESEEALSS